jgi:sugar phosphate permease
MGLSLFLSLLAAVAMAYASTFGVFLGIALVYGLVSGGGLTLGYSIGSRRFPEASRGESFGKLSGAALIGGAVAPALAALLARSTIEAVYWMNALIYVALIAVCLVFLRGTATED